MRVMSGDNDDSGVVVVVVPNIGTRVGIRTARAGNVLDEDLHCVLLKGFDAADGVGAAHDDCVSG